MGIFSLAPCFLSLLGLPQPHLPSLLSICLTLPPCPCLCPGGEGRGEGEGAARHRRKGRQQRISFLLSGQQSLNSPQAGFGHDPRRPRCSLFCSGHLNTVQPLLPFHRQPCEEFRPINSSTSPWQHRLPTLPKIRDRSAATKAGLLPLPRYAGGPETSTHFQSEQPCHLSSYYAHSTCLQKHPHPRWSNPYPATDASADGFQLILGFLSDCVPAFPPHSTEIQP